MRRALLSFVDVLFLIVLMLIILPHQPTVDPDEDPPGVMSVEVTWPEQLPADVDLWVRGPKDRAVGYSNKAGVIFNLLRDDLGNTADPLPLNYENAYGRGVIPGDYVVNLHFYRAHTKDPIPVSWVVKMQPPGALNMITVANGVETLLTVGDEVTVIRFTVTEKFEVVNVHYLPVKLRN